MPLMPRAALAAYGYYAPSPGWSRFANGQAHLRTQDLNHGRALCAPKWCPHSGGDGCPRIPLYIPSPPDCPAPVVTYISAQLHRNYTESTKAWRFYISKPLILQVPRDGIEPPTRGFSVLCKPVFSESMRYTQFFSNHCKNGDKFQCIAF